jgi:hypothetical protein
VENKSTVDTIDSFGKKVIEGEYIIIFENQFDGRIDNPTAQQAEQLTSEIISSSNIAESAIRSTYKYAIKGFSAKLSESKVKALERDPRIRSVTPNVLFKLDYTSKLGTEYLSDKKEAATNYVVASSQSIPWGISRVGGSFDGTGEKAWILDSGIDLDHPDLNVDISNSVSFIAKESADDKVGHGTHVAGILAAKNNSRDVVGVAAGASVVAVKVCNSLPPSDPESGCPADVIIDGLDYVSTNAQPDDIINMSLGGPAYSPIDNTIISAANNGIRFTVSAGNEQQQASNVSPARVEHSNVWTVSAYDDTDAFATSFSNYGNPPIEYGGPGVDILSLYRNGGTATLSGTSMAAPHAAGLLLTSPNGLTDDGFVSGDPDNDPDPIAIADIYLSVSISGPSSLTKGQQGTWTASVSDGDGNYSYKWYYRSDDTNNQWNGPVSYTSSYSTTMYSFDGLTLDIRVDVSDGSQRNGSRTMTVRCSDCDPGGGGGPLSVDSDN